MWRKNGKGPVYRSIRVTQPDGGQMMILIATTKNKKGESYKNVEANSWQMLKAGGWKKVG